MNEDHGPKRFLLRPSDLTLDNVVELFRRLTGREPTQAELREAEEVLETCKPTERAMAAELAAAMVTGLRRATGTSDQLAGPPPTLQDMNIDLVGCTPLEIENIERMVRVIWERAAKQ